MGRSPWILLPAWIALLAVGGCGGGERDSPSVGSPPKATLFLAGDGELIVLDADAGRAEGRPLSELAPGDPPYRIARRENELVLWGRDTYVLDPDLRSSPRRLGDSWFFIPSVKTDRVWLAVLDPASPETVRALATLREVSLDGRVTFPAVRPPGGRWPVAAVGDELVFEDRRGGLELWNPATGEFTRRLPGAARGPSHGNLLAWCEDEGRILHVSDVASGREQTVAPPPGVGAFDCWNGAFSPDGRSLAVPAAAGEGYEAERALTIVDLASGVARTVEASTVDPGYVFVAWSSGGEQVFLSGGERERQLLQYRPGEQRALPLAVDVQEFYGMAAR
jgi:hypothetical protein